MEDSLSNINYFSVSTENSLYDESSKMKFINDTNNEILSISQFSKYDSIIVIITKSKIIHFHKIINNNETLLFQPIKSLRLLSLINHEIKCVIANMTTEEIIVKTNDSIIKLTFNMFDFFIEEQFINIDNIFSTIIFAFIDDVIYFTNDRLNLLSKSITKLFHEHTVIYQSDSDFIDIVIDLKNNKFFVFTNTTIIIIEETNTRTLYSIENNDNIGYYNNNYLLFILNRNEIRALEVDYLLKPKNYTVKLQNSKKYGDVSLYKIIFFNDKILIACNKAFDEVYIINKVNFKIIYKEILYTSNHMFKIISNNNSLYLIIFWISNNSLKTKILFLSLEEHKTIANKDLSSIDSFDINTIENEYDKSFCKLSINALNNLRYFNNKIKQCLNVINSNSKQSVISLQTVINLVDIIKETMKDRLNICLLLNEYDSSYENKNMLINISLRNLKISYNIKLVTYTLSLVNINLVLCLIKEHIILQNLLRQLIIKEASDLLTIAKFYNNRRVYHNIYRTITKILN